MLLDHNLLLDIPPDPGGISGIAVVVLLMIVMLAVAGFIGSFVAVLIWRKRAKTKAVSALDYPGQELLDQNAGGHTCENNASE